MPRMSEEDRAYLRHLYDVVDNMGLTFEALKVALEMAFERGYTKGRVKAEEMPG